MELCVHNSGSRETLNSGQVEKTHVSHLDFYLDVLFFYLALSHVSSCKMFHFVTSCMNKNKNVKRLLRVQSTDWK